jgi:hypothetical protein
MLKQPECFDSSVGIVPRVGRPGNRGSILYMGRKFFPQSVQKDCVVFTVSYSVSAMGFFPQG